MSWPTEYGGGGLSPMEQVVLAEEFARAGQGPPPVPGELFPLVGRQRPGSGPPGRQ
ncbi:acyl-CoA dehydrogenase family protein, partial [Escherichia coli]|uniref:acyl-CoA dehydrogenase family protein n=1 Tax=Escherichia coli TaxID=562 RepID=UPI00398B6C6F